MEKNPLSFLGVPGADGPCHDAYDWYMTRSTPRDAWESCDRPDWLLWLIGRLEIPGAEKVAFAIADHAVRVDAAGALEAIGTTYKLPELIEHAAKLRALPPIVDRASADAAYSAAYSAARSAADSAAYSAARSAAYAAESAARSAAYAAESAASAAYAAYAADAAYSAAGIRIAGIVREHFPWEVIAGAIAARVGKVEV